METERIQELLKKIESVQIAVYGDFCLDAYWMLHPKGGEISVETGLMTQAVERHYYSLGGASNIVANLAALHPAQIRVIGVIGDDIFGRELTRQLQQLGVDTSSLFIQKENFSTVTFAKRYLHDQEQPRIDFGFLNQRSPASDEWLLQSIETALQQCDAMIFNQQVPGSIPNPHFIERVNRLFQTFHDKIVLLDSRHYSEQFRSMYRKTNDREAARLNGRQTGPDDIIPLADVKQYALNLFRQSNKPVFITRGPRGMIVADATGIQEVPGIQILKKLDTVGAGDTTSSALALCLAAGVTPYEAAQFANLAAAVTVQKIFQTGTASSEEILDLAPNADYISQPELAEDIRQAQYLPGTEIEICTDVHSLPRGRIKHAVFDHDGTISTLRQGWEQVMEPVMVKAILGDQYQNAEETLYHRVLARVRDYIQKSTGIQTLQQMDALADMVREFAVVPPDQILDRFGYKKIYNDALMQRVRLRINKFQSGQLDLHDFTLKGAIDFLHALKNRGVTLYLASGTDRQDVLDEAAVLGYAGLFENRIYGAVGDIRDYSKRMVIDSIMTQNRLQGPELAVFGDGPVEIREARRRNGLAVGLASDEIRRYGLDISKRSRLIKAGAQVIIPDYSESDQILRLLHIHTH